VRRDSSARGADESGTRTSEGGVCRTLDTRLESRTAVRLAERHDLRHTCATLLLSRGTHPKLVQHLLGHASISMTLDRYSHWIPTMAGSCARSDDHGRCCAQSLGSEVLRISLQMAGRMLVNRRPLSKLSDVLRAIPERSVTFPTRSNRCLTTLPPASTTVGGIRVVSKSPWFVSGGFQYSEYSA
jgi:Phage integrase family